MCLFAVTPVLPANQIVGHQGAHGLKDLGFLGVDCAVSRSGRRLHGKQGHYLKQMILDDIAQATSAFIKSATILDSRSEESRVRKECVSTCRSRWSQTQ